MRKLLTSALATFALLSGCATAPGTLQTPAQIAANFCPSAQIALTSMQGLVGVSASTTENLANAARDITVVCAMGATVQSTDLKTLALNALPVLATIVKASTLAVDAQNPILLDIGLAQIAIGILP